MKKHAVLLLALVPHIAMADFDDTESNNWLAEGLTHYIRSKEDSNFVAQLVSIGRNSSIVAFYDVKRTCFGDGGDRKKVKIFYQWVNYTKICRGGTGYWIPSSQRGIDFVSQKFTSNSDVKVLFGGNNYSFSTKNFPSVRQHWESTLRTSGDAL